MLRLNSSYGHRQILMSYAGVPDQPIHAFLQHGWTLRPDAGNGRYAKSTYFKSAPRLCWSQRQALDAADAGIPYTVSIGAPFLYLLRTLGSPVFPQLSRPEPPESVLVYTTHSAEFTPSAQLENVSAVQRLVGGRDCTVVLHPVDASRLDTVQAYESSGLRVITHGRHRYDPYFLVRQLYELERHAEVFVFGIGTAALYAAAIGKRVRFYPPAATDPTQASSMPDPSLLNSRSRALKNLHDAGDFQEFAAAELGVRDLKDPDELKELLGAYGMRRVLARTNGLAGRAQAGFRRRLLRDESAGG